MFISHVISQLCITNAYCIYLIFGEVMQHQIHCSIFANPQRNV